MPSTKRRGVIRMLPSEVVTGGSAYAAVDVGIGSGDMRSIGPRPLVVVEVLLESVPQSTNKPDTAITAANPT